MWNYLHESRQDIVTNMGFEERWWKGSWKSALPFVAVRLHDGIERDRDYFPFHRSLWVCGDDVACDGILLDNVNIRVNVDIVKTADAIADNAVVQVTGWCSCVDRVVPCVPFPLRFWPDALRRAKIAARLFLLLVNNARSCSVESCSGDDGCERVELRDVRLVRGGCDIILK